MPADIQTIARFLVFGFCFLFLVLVFGIGIQYY